MRVREMRVREDFDRILADTLSAGWSEQLERPARVQAGGTGPGQRWGFEPTLSAYFVGGIRPAARRFLRESFQFTPVRWRLPAQWALARVLTSTVGLRLAARPGFTVLPPIPGAESMLVVPGNQRVRVFDLHSSLTRVFMKSGFDPAGLRTEIGVRGGGAEGPFVPIVGHGTTWFEEPIFDGYALPRCPPWHDRSSLAHLALSRLEAWLDRTRRLVEASTYVSALVSRFEGDLVSLALPEGTLQVLRRAAAVLADQAVGLGEVALAVGHGDFQPGNVLATRDGKDVRLIDWEHSAERWRHYDRFTWALGGRSGASQSRRLSAYVAGGVEPLLRDVPLERRERGPAVALYLLEDLHWFARESHVGPYRGVSRGLARRIAELPALVAATRQRP